LNDAGKKVRKNIVNIRRSLAHSDLDVAELSNRQSARSALDRQRLATSVSTILTTRNNLKSLYNEYTWPKLLYSQCSVWDDTVRQRYYKRWSTVSTPFSFSSSENFLLKTLAQHEEVLFSRKRRFFTVINDVHQNNSNYYKNKSYVNFSQTKINDELNATKRMKERQQNLKELSALASGIRNAIATEDEEGVDSAVAVSSRDSNSNSIDTTARENERERDGWEAEDDAWDQAAKISEERATRNVDSPRRGTATTTAIEEDNEEDSDYYILFKDTNCACIEPDVCEPILGKETIFLFSKKNFVKKNSQKFSLQFCQFCQFCQFFQFF
jgi:hypothetical protein